MKFNPQLKQDLINYIKDRQKGNIKPKVVVIAPYELSSSELDAIKQKVPLLKEAQVSVEVDKTIMAGIIIKYGSQVIDLSLNSELHKLEQTLYETA
jgi:F0F1-type ATP synthase delta subunit